MYLPLLLMIYVRLSRRHDHTTHLFLLLYVYSIASSLLSSYLPVLRMISQLSSLICTWTVYINHQQRKKSLFVLHIDIYFFFLTMNTREKKPTYSLRTSDVYRQVV